MEPIRVLQVFNIMNCGGAETTIMNYYRCIDRTKIQFDFLVHRHEKGVYDDEIESLGGKIYRLSNFNPLKIKSYKKEIKEFLLEHPEYRIIHAHNCTTNMYELREAKKLKLPMRIAHSHLSQRELDYKTPFFWYNNKRINSFCTHRFACGYDAGVWHFGRNKSDIKIINNSININKFRFNPHNRLQLREVLNLKNKLVIGHIGRFNSSKNHKFLIKVFNEVFKKNNEAVLLLVGEGQLENLIKEMVKEMNIEENVIFLGLRKDIDKILNIMDIIVFPSLFEGVPMSLVEAQASGIKCLISDTIPKEVALTDLIQFSSLDSSPSYWAQKVLDFNLDYDRKIYADEIREAGYDILNNVEILTDFYLNGGKSTL